MSELLGDLPDPKLYIFKAFAKEGWLQKALPGYAPREGQLRLAQKIDAAMRDQRHLIAEGPTGIGKSLAYGVPLAYHTVANDQRGLIVTANIALQEQLVKKDLPLLKATLPWEFSFALLKGRSNYLCHDQRDHMRSHHPFIRNKTHLQMLDEQEGTDHHKRIDEWSNDTQTGDISELDFQPTPKEWSRFSVHTEECKGSNCKFYYECLANRASSLAASSHITVLNYHVLFSYIQYAQEALDEVRCGIFDEAHKVVDIARGFFGFRLTEGMFHKLANKLQGEFTNDASKSIDMYSSQLFSELKLILHSRAYRTRFRSTVETQSPSLAALIRVLENAEMVLINRTRKLQGGGKAVVAALAVAENLSLLTRRYLTNLIAMRDCDERLAIYLEEDGERAALCAKLIDVSKDMGKFFDKMDSFSLLSATLSVGGSFDHVSHGLGTPPEITDYFVAESPFDWQKQAALVIPEDFVDPKDRNKFKTEVATAVGYIVEQVKGRTLALFTSWTGLNAAYDFLKPRCKYPIFKQGEAPRTLLVEQFKNSTNGVLMGVESFWQGIDIPGDALVCVIIDKLPFPNIDDPVLDALEEKENTFKTYSIPHMVISLKQGFGRLIRSVDDYGVVVILDKRVHTKWQAYGRVLVNSLPQVRTSVDLDDVGKFIQEMQANQKGARSV